MKNLIYVFAVCMAVACSNSDKEVKLLEDAVMVVHDEVMPKSDKLIELKKLVTEKSATDSTAVRLAADLQAADDAMMDWMAGYELPEGTIQEKAAYLQTEKKKIDEVKVKINSSIEQAEAFLKK